MSGLEIRKAILEAMILPLLPFFRPHPAFLRDPRIQALKETLETMEGLEPDPVVRARWKALKAFILWLTTQDGAYRVRAIRLAQEVCRRRKAWKLRPWECRYWEPSAGQ